MAEMTAQEYQKGLWAGELWAWQLFFASLKQRAERDIWLRAIHEHRHQEQVAARGTNMPPPGREFPVDKQGWVLPS